MRRGPVAICLVAALAGCTVGSTNNAGAPGTTQSQPTSTTTPAAAVTTSTLPAAGATNLRVTDTIRAQLLAAGAAVKGLPTSDYVGLTAGLTYYAYDADTQTYWAGASLDPAPNAYQAQVDNQDEGYYLIFQRPAGGNWVATQAGLTGGAGASCPVQIPNAVLSVWNWPAGTCNPPASQYPTTSTT